eukprot:669791-Pyramimonas_sp.AAC.2
MRVGSDGFACAREARTSRGMSSAHASMGAGGGNSTWILSRSLREYLRARSPREYVDSFPVVLRYCRGATTKLQTHRNVAWHAFDQLRAIQVAEGLEIFDSCDRWRTQTGPALYRGGRQNDIL